MALVTVLTPTYNRCKNLRALFRSLKAQSNKNFEWLIVDDGSSDGTAELVKEFLEEKTFAVRYIYKENGGKHTALNAGIKEITTELTFIVDSDDTVHPEGIATIETYYNKYKREPGIGFFSFLKQNIRSGVMLKMPRDEYIGSYVEERIKNSRPGDMAEVFLTDALREFPFPEFDGEKFLSEDVVWIPLGLKYKTVFINKVIYLFEYLQDGLTRNDKRHKFASPLGSIMRGKMLMKKECGSKEKIRGAIIYGCYRFELQEEIPQCAQLECTMDRLIVMMVLPLSFLFYRKWKKQAGV